MSNLFDFTKKYKDIIMTDKIRFAGDNLLVYLDELQQLDEFKDTKLNIMPIPSCLVDNVSLVARTVVVKDKNNKFRFNNIQVDLFRIQISPPLFDFEMMHNQALEEYGVYYSSLLANSKRDYELIRLLLCSFTPINDIQEKQKHFDEELLPKIKDIYFNKLDMDTNVECGNWVLVQCSERSIVNF